VEDIVGKKLHASACTGVEKLTVVIKPAALTAVTIATIVLYTILHIYQKSLIIGSEREQ
jgi:hypothetical protein